MKQDIKERWVARLRSGQDEQGKGELRSDDDKKCCLGVLCEIAVEDGIIAPPVLQYGAYVYDGHYHSFLPPKVQKWAGLDDGNPVVRYAEDHDGRAPLGSLNDSDGDYIPEFDFLKIADLIEEQL